MSKIIIHDTNLNIRISKELNQKLTERAKKEKIGKSKWIRRIIKNELFKSTHL